MAKKRFAILFVLLILLIPLFLMSGCTEEYSVYLPREDSGYYLSNYNVQINVEKDRTLRVKESITAHFESGLSNGIYRYIPLTQTVGYFDENDKFVEKNYRSSIDGFTYNSDTTSIYNQFRENGYQFYALKRKGELVNKEYTFEFGYNYHLPDDRESDFDMLYYNIIGTGWDTSIKNLTFSVEFPDDGGLRESGLEFYVGRLGESVSTDSRFSYSVNGNVVTGSCNNLRYGEAVTLYTDFEEGYFKVEKSLLADFVILGIAIIGVIAIVLLYVKHKKKNDIVEVVQFKAPEGLSPVEAGYIIDGIVTGDDISALIVYWASKGFVKIEQQGDDNIITKVKELPEGAKEHQRIFFAELFKRGDSVSAKSLSSINPHVGEKIKNSVEGKEVLYFNTKGKKSALATLIWPLVALVISALNVAMESLKMPLFLWRLLIIAVAFVGAFWHMEICDRRFKYGRGKFWTLWAISFLIAVAPLVVNIFIGEGYCDTFGSRIWLIILPIATVLIYRFLERHSSKGRQVMGDLLGLRNFILLAEKDRIEALANENPTVFYDVLPFAYVLGVSDVYMEKFKDVPIAKPQWLSSPDGLDLWIMLNVLNTNTLKIGNTISRYLPNSLTKLGKFASNLSRMSGGSSGRGGGSFGGGGFSGGGHGGGGGGRF